MGPGGNGALPGSDASTSTAAAVGDKDVKNATVDGQNLA